MLWHTDIGTSPFAAAPLIADINGDTNLEIVAAPFSETITVLEGDSGKSLPNSHWPLHNLETTFHASPLQVQAVFLLLFFFCFLTCWVPTRWVHPSYCSYSPCVCKMGKPILVFSWIFPRPKIDTASQIFTSSVGVHVFPEYSWEEAVFVNDCFQRHWLTLKQRKCEQASETNYAPKMFSLF